MAEYLTRDLVENIPLNSAIPFLDSIPCNKGYVYHQSGTGIFVIRGIVNNPSTCFARYNIEFTGNISIPEGGTVTPIATAIVVSGESREGSRSIFTPAEVDEYGNVTSRATVNVPKGCCFTVSVEYVNGTVNDTTTVPTPSINFFYFLWKKMLTLYHYSDILKSSKGNKPINKREVKKYDIRKKC